LKAEIITHKQLVKRAGIWLRNNQVCTVVLTELTTSNSEIPDVLGFFSNGGGSILIECKATRADFLADKKKIFRQHPEMGMGLQRYLATPKALVKEEELPNRWGLLWLTEHRVTVVKEASGSEEYNKRAEITMLVSVLRRLEISTAVFVRQKIN